MLNYNLSFAAFHPMLPLVLDYLSMVRTARDSVLLQAKIPKQINSQVRLFPPTWRRIDEPQQRKLGPARAFIHVLRTFINIQRMQSTAVGTSKIGCNWWGVKQALGC